ncbi:hypothetical protein TcCL_NonESM03420 [Trypanosoma cruzi]|nr:hypothetical protein TcCL_NonESM03420 [Trypanosoma cruzi]
MDKKENNHRNDWQPQQECHTCGVTALYSIHKDHRNDGEWMPTTQHGVGESHKNNNVVRTKGSPTHPARYGPAPVWHRLHCTHSTRIDARVNVTFNTYKHTSGKEIRCSHGHTQTLRGQCPVSCADSARGFWARRCATRCDPSERNSRSVPFRSHSWRLRYPLPRLVLLASTKMLQCEKERVPSTSGAGLGGQYPPRQDSQRDS